MTAVSGAQSLAAVTGSVRHCIGEYRKRILAYWQNSAGGMSYCLFIDGFRERTYEDRADKYSRFRQAGNTTGDADNPYKTQYLKANRVVVVEQTATILNLTSDEALYISDMIQARRLQVLDEWRAEFFSPDFELRIAQTYGYDQNTYEATLTIRYPQYGTL
jgi:hypothetical protein